MCNKTLEGPYNALLNLLPEFEEEKKKAMKGKNKRGTRMKESRRKSSTEAKARIEVEVGYQIQTGF